MYLDFLFVQPDLGWHDSPTEMYFLRLGNTALGIWENTLKTRTRTTRITRTTKKNQLAVLN